MYLGTYEIASRVLRGQEKVGFRMPLCSELKDLKDRLKNSLDLLSQKSDAYYDALDENLRNITIKNNIPHRILCEIFDQYLNKYPKISHMKLFDEYFTYDFLPDNYKNKWPEYMPYPSVCWLVFYVKE